MTIHCLRPRCLSGSTSSKVLSFLGLGLTFCATVSAADFAVSSPGFFYDINGLQPNPTLTLVRGRTYTFSIATSAIHPFKILSAGVQNNNISSGTITYTVPTAASNYAYICSIHLFGGEILTIPPSAPPKIEILGVSLGTNLVVRSTGTNGWAVLPEYSTNLMSTSWFALNVVTNRYLSGTNETICGRPPKADVFIRIRSKAN